MANVPRAPATLTDSCAANAALKGCGFSRFPADFALFFVSLEQRMLHALHVTRFRLTNFKPRGGVIVGFTSSVGCQQVVHHSSVLG